MCLGSEHPDRTRMNVSGLRSRPAVLEGRPNTSVFNSSTCGLIGQQSTQLTHSLEERVVEKKKRRVRLDEGLGGLLSVEMPHTRAPISAAWQRCVRLGDPSPKLGRWTPRSSPASSHCAKRCPVGGDGNALESVCTMR